MNAVYVSRNYYSQDKARNAFLCDSFNWLHGAPADVHSSAALAAADRLHVKVRHGERMYECLEFKAIDGGERAYVELSESDQGLAAGQYAVFYRDGVCLGSAVMKESVAVRAAGQALPANALAAA